MNRLSLPPLNFEAALVAVQTWEEVWNECSADKSMELFSPDCEWLYAGICWQGSEQIFAALQKYWQCRLHFKCKAELWTHSFSRLAIRFYAEWQQANNGQWQQCQGSSLLQLDNDGRIRELYQSESVLMLASSDRKLSRGR